MIKYIKNLIPLVVIVGIIVIFLLQSCARTTMGKVQLKEEIPPFLTVGKTTLEDVLTQIGEPFGYREKGSRSAMIFVSFRESYIWILIGVYHKEEAHNLNLVFEDEILQKAEINKVGWGFGANVDPQLMQMLLR